MKRRFAILFLTVLFVSAVVLGWRTFNGAESTPALAAQSTEATILTLEERVTRYPSLHGAHAELGLAYLQRLQETGELAYYGQAEQSFANAELAFANTGRDGRQPFNLLLGRGMLALSRHQFEEALDFGRQARALNAYSAPALGVIVDAYIELGRYDETADALQTMVNLRPDLASYSRVAYIRELHGDLDGALEAMQLAMGSVPAGSEAMLWALLQVSDLHASRGNLQEAEHAYRQVLSFRPDDPDAHAGLAELSAARGDYEQAILEFRRLAADAPSADIYETLGNLHAITGDSAAAERAYQQALTFYHDEAAVGVEVELELARFYAEQEINVEEALELARRGYARQKTYEASDIMAWAHYQNGDYETAWRYNLEARRAGGRDPHFFFHGGMIALARGEEAVGRALLAEALAINPTFSLKDAATARANLR